MILELRLYNGLASNKSIHMQVFTKDVDKETAVILGARASRVENQDAIDACIVGMLADPKEVISTSRCTCMCVAVKFNNC